VRDLEALGAKLDRERDDVLQMRQVAPVDRRVDRERQAGGANPMRGLDLAREAAREAADVVGIDRVAVLDAELHVVEPGLDQARDPCLVEQDPGGDEVAVKAEPGGVFDERLQVVARRWLTAREMHLQDT
jgi:hypothetical protein